MEKTDLPWYDFDYSTDPVQQVVLWCSQRQPGRVKQWDWQWEDNETSPPGRALLLWKLSHFSSSGQIIMILSLVFAYLFLNSIDILNKERILFLRIIVVVLLYVPLMFWCHFKEIY